MRGIGLIWLRIRILESPCECSIESPGSTSHGVSKLFIHFFFLIIYWPKDDVCEQTLFNSLLIVRIATSLVQKLMVKRI